MKQAELHGDEYFAELDYMSELSLCTYVFAS